MSYAIISLGGKQYRVSEGQTLLVDRLPTEDGKTFTPDVLLVGGDGGTVLAPKDVTVTVKVLGQQRGPKIRIGKYKKRTGYKRHTGFRAALTQIEIESIGAKKRAARRSRRPRQQPEAEAERAGRSAGRGGRARWHTRRGSAPRRTVATPRASASASRSSPARRSRRA